MGWTDKSLLISLYVLAQYIPPHTYMPSHTYIPHTHTYPTHIHAPHTHILWVQYKNSFVLCMPAHICKYFFLSYNLTHCRVLWLVGKYLNILVLYCIDHEHHFCLSTVNTSPCIHLSQHSIAFGQSLPAMYWEILVYTY